MAEHVIKLRDVGEGVAEAELVEWHVKVGDLVREDDLLAAVMTDKATVEIPSPVAGEVVWLGAKIGDTVPVGSELVRLKVPGEEGASAAKEVTAPSVPPAEPAQPQRSALHDAGGADLMAAAPSGAAGQPARTARARPIALAPRPEGEKPLASPAVRLRAREAGIDLRQVPGTGPAGRITHADLDAFLRHGPVAARAPSLQARTAVTEVKVAGLRRRIAERMALANARIPHITYVEEVDVSALEELRATLNRERRQDQPKLTLLPFLMRAMVRAVSEQPNLNALYDDEAGVVHQHAGVHIGMATQTPALAARLIEGGIIGIRVPSAQASGANLVLWRWNAGPHCRVAAFDPLSDLPRDQSSWRS
jgi:2-oxoisovalerate dehydrogenase E2 component (dihydrolipoyl transacylase)